ncbi:MAG: hypothetical protein WBD67_01565 [Terracidiphilus sp.]
MLASTKSFSVAETRTASERGAAHAMGVKQRRRIDRESGRALEILGHAIEYLQDEHVHRGGSLSSNDGEVLAIQLLMARNREIYLACPVVPTLWERCSGWLARWAS